MIILPSVRKGLVGRRGASQFAAPGLPVWSAAVRNAIAGISDANVMFIGNSETAGEGAGEADTAHVNGRNRSMPSQLADLFSGNLASMIERRAIWGTGNYTAPEMAIYAPEMTAGAGWSSSGSGGLGAARLLNNTTSNPLSFVSSGGCDTADVYFVVQSSNGLVSIDIDGGTPVTSNLNGGNAVRKLTVTGSGLGAHTLNVIRTSGGFVQWIATVWRNSTAKKIYFHNCGAGSSKVSDWIANAAPWQAYPMVASQAYQLYVIQLGVNDWPATAQATYESGLQTLITQCKLSGDVLLVGSAQRSVNAAEQAAFFTSLQTLATANGLPAPINFKDILGAYATAVANGDMYDVTHPNIPGYTKEAYALAPALGFTSTLSLEAGQFLARISQTDPDKVAFTGMINYFVAQNKWSLIESLYIRNVANKATSLENVKSNKRRGIQTGLANGAFAAYGGWTGDGNPAHFIDNNQNPSVSPGILTQDDCAYGEYITAGTISGIQSGGGNANLYFQFYNDGQFYYRPQSAADIAVGPNPANPLGLWIVTRTGVNAGAVYRDDVLYASDSGGDVAFKNQSLVSLGLAGIDSSTLTTKATFVTRGLSAGDAAIFRAGINAFFP